MPVSQIASLFKCSQYKQSGSLKRVFDGAKKSETVKIDLGQQVNVDSKYMDQVQEVDQAGNQSNFTRVSPSTASQDLTQVTQMISSFLIGPQFGGKDQDFVDVYAPYVYLKTKDGQLTKF